MRLYQPKTISHRTTLPSEDSSSNLIVRIAEQKDRRAFSTLFERHKTKCFNILLKVLRNRSLAEDSLQEGMLRIWNNAHYFNPKNANASAWITRVVVREGLRHSKNLGRKKRLEDDYGQEKAYLETEPISLVENINKNERTEIFQNIFNHLPVTDREILSLYFGAEYSQDDIAKELHIPQSTVSLRIKSSLSNIRRSLAVAGYASLIALPEFFAGIKAAIGNGEPVQHNISEEMNSRTMEFAETNSSYSHLASPLAGAALILAGLFIGISIQMPENGKGKGDNDKFNLPQTNSLKVNNWNRPERINRYWNFDSPTTPESLIPVQGSLIPLRNKGINGSGCIQIASETVLCIDFPVRELPVLLSYKLHPISLEMMSSPNKRLELNHMWGSTVSKFGIYNWDSNNRNDGIFQKSPWLDCKVYIKENLTELWIAGNRRTVTYNQRKLPGKNYIYLSIGCFMDDLRIQSITPDQCPDSAKLEKSIREIEIENQKGILHLPGVQSSHPTQPVFIDFYPRKPLTTFEK